MYKLPIIHIPGIVGKSLDYLIGSSCMICYNLTGNNGLSDYEGYPCRCGSSKNEIFFSLTDDQKVQYVYVARKGYEEQQREFYGNAFSKKYPER